MLLRTSGIVEDSARLRARRTLQAGIVSNDSEFIQEDRVQGIYSNKINPLCWPSSQRTLNGPGRTAKGSHRPKRKIWLSRESKYQLLGFIPGT